MMAADIFAGRERRAAFAIASLLALKLALLFLFAWNIRFVMDEFGQLGYAKHLGNGLFETIQPPKAVGFALFYKAAHWVGWDAPSILLAGRMQTALLACGTIAMVYAVARGLGESRVRALAILLVLLCFSNFIERIFRTIAEPLALFFAVAALLVVVRGRAQGAAPLVVAGILSGFSFLATQKAVYFNLALGLALFADAALARHYLEGIRRGALLVLGWLVAIAAYCLILGGSDPGHILNSLVYGPVEVASRGGAEYGGLRGYVLQTLARNLILYAFCFAGMALALARIRSLDSGRRIALLFSLVITILVFAHDQPWPYVFIMALPFIALWALVPLDRLAAGGRPLLLPLALLAVALLVSFVGNARYLRIDNDAQLELVARAEALLGPDDAYFDGIGMLPNRREPSTLWLDRHFVLATLREGRGSEAWRIFTRSPPKVILWSYRMDDIAPVVAPALARSYVAVAPNLRIAGRRLRDGRTERFDVPVAGRYRLYDSGGRPVAGEIDAGGRTLSPPLRLSAGPVALTLRNGPPEALLLPEGAYDGVIARGPDDKALFAHVYD